MQKSHPKVVNPRDIAGERKKKKKKKKVNPHFLLLFFDLLFWLEEQMMRNLWENATKSQKLLSGLCFDDQRISDQL